MLIPTIIMGVIALALTFYAYSRGEGEHIKGLQEASSLFISILPLLLFAFTVAGMANALISPESISKWVGPESGSKGIFIGSIAGALCPGGPFVSMPIAAALVRMGADVSTMVAFLTGWSLLAINRLPLEVGFMGWKLTAIRFASTFFMAPIAGYVAKIILKVLK